MTKHVVQEADNFRVEVVSWSQNGVEHVQRFDESLLPCAPLAQLFKGDKAILVGIDFLQKENTFR